MKLALSLVGLLCFGLVEFSQAATAPLTISQSTAFCETAVPNYCVQTTCPLFCNTFRTKRQRDLCNPGCTTSNRCQNRPIGLTNADNTNVALDAQNREQLIACIAEKRDPSGKTTGRRMTPWQDIRVPSYTRATRP